MKKKGVRAAAISLVVLGAVLSFGCCGEEQAEEPVQITLLHGWGGISQTHALMREIYQEFSRENPDIQLVCKPSSDSSIAVEQANDLLAVDRPADIVSTNGLSYYVENMVSRGKALDLIPYIRKDPEFAQELHPSITEVWGTAENSLYTIPDALEVMGYWYNREYFQQAGIVDAAGEPKTPDTWEELFADCQILEQWADENKKEMHVFAMDKEQAVEGVFLARLAGMGEEGLKLASALPSTFRGPQIARTLEDIRKLYGCSLAVNSTENARQEFLEGKSAIYFNGVWESGILSEKQQAAAYSNFPTDRGQSLSYVSPSSGYVIARNPDKKKEEACVRFLKYMLSDEVQTRIAVETGQAPANPNVDMGKVEEASPLLREALEAAYGADIRIATISSAWTGAAANSLKSNIYQASQSQEGCSLLIDKMEDTIF